MISWKHNQIKLETVYTVEYIDNAKDYETFCRQGAEQWDVVKKRTFTGDVGAALLFYFARMYDENTKYYHLFEEVFVDGEKVREATIEPDSSFTWCLRGWIAKDATARLNKMEQENKAFRDDRELLQQFLDKDSSIRDRFQSYCKMVRGW